MASPPPPPSLTPTIADIQKQILSSLSSFREEVVLFDRIQATLPGVEPKDVSAALRGLLESRRVTLIRGGAATTATTTTTTTNSSSTGGGAAAAAPLYLSLANNLPESAAMVLDAVRSSGSSGIDHSQLLQRLRLPRVELSKSLQLLLADKFIKEQRSFENRAKKIYLLFHLTPSAQVTGGSFYQNRLQSGAGLGATAAPSGGGLAAPTAAPVEPLERGRPLTALHPHSPPAAAGAGRAAAAPPRATATPSSASAYPPSYHGATTISGAAAAVAVGGAGANVDDHLDVAFIDEVRRRLVGFVSLRRAASQRLLLQFARGEYVDPHPREASSAASPPPQSFLNTTNNNNNNDFSFDDAEIRLQTAAKTDPTTTDLTNATTNSHSNNNHSYLDSGEVVIASPVARHSLPRTTLSRGSSSSIVSSPPPPPAAPSAAPHAAPFGREPGTATAYNNLYPPPQQPPQQQQARRLSRQDALILVHSLYLDGVLSFYEVDPHAAPARPSGARRHEDYSDEDDAIVYFIAPQERNIMRHFTAQPREAAPRQPPPAPPAAGREGEEQPDGPLQGGGKRPASGELPTDTQPKRSRGEVEVEDLRATIKKEEAAEDEAVTGSVRRWPSYHSSPEALAAAEADFLAAFFPATAATAGAAQLAAHRPAAVRHLFAQLHAAGRWQPAPIAAELPSWRYLPAVGLPCLGCPQLPLCSTSGRGVVTAALCRHLAEWEL